MKTKSAFAAIAITMLLTGSANATQTYTTGVGVNEHNPTANNAARAMARSRCESIGGSVQSYQVTSSELVDLPDTRYSVGGQTWVVNVRATCVFIP